MDEESYLIGYYTGLVEAKHYTEDSRLAALMKEHGMEEGIKIAAREVVAIKDDLRAIGDVIVQQEVSPDEGHNAEAH